LRTVVILRCEPLRRASKDEKQGLCGSSFEARKSALLRMTAVCAVTKFVMAGLDPAIHLLLKKDGYAGQARV
jgi:hypothetical protein